MSIRVNPLLGRKWGEKSVVVCLIGKHRDRARRGARKLRNERVLSSLCCLLNIFLQLENLNVRETCSLDHANEACIFACYGTFSIPFDVKKIKYEEVLCPVLCCFEASKHEEEGRFYEIWRNPRRRTLAISQSCCFVSSLNLKTGKMIWNWNTVWSFQMYGIYHLK